MDTKKKDKSLTADEIGTIRLTPSTPPPSSSSYVIPPPPIDSQFTYRSSITYLNIDWTRVRPYQKKK
jgi:hypothetical protein